MTTWTYNPQRGWLDNKRDADDKGADYTYTAAGRLATRTWARGLTTTYSYGEGMLGSVTYSDNTTPDLDYVYDSFGRLETVKQGHATGGSPHHQWDYSYHPANLTLTGEVIQYDTDADGTADFIRHLERTRDPVLRPEQVTLGSAADSDSDFKIQSSYDSAGRLHRIRNFYGINSNGNRTSNCYYTYSYHTDSLGQVRTIRLVHRVNSSGGVFDVTGTHVRTLESDRDLLAWTGLGMRANQTGNRSRFDYTNNALGQRIAVDSSGSLNSTASIAWDWGYNQRGEVISADANWDSAESQFYSYDAIGNRDYLRTGTSTDSGGSQLQYSADSLNQYDSVQTSAATLVPAYDLDGNAVAYPLPVAPGALATIAWDGENRMENVTKSGGETVAYEYDYLGRRIAKRIDGGDAEWFVYDGWNMIAQYQQTSANSPDLAYRYIWGLDLAGQAGGSAQGAGGVGGLLTIRDVNQATDYVPAYDGNGNITGLGKVLTSNGDGFANAASYSYDAFGNLIDSQDIIGDGFKDKNPFRFSTKFADAETGLYYYGYRYYDPVTGRWPSRDPLKERGGVNLYEFVLNDPIGYLDVLGLFPIGWSRQQSGNPIDWESLLPEPSTVDLLKEALKETLSELGETGKNLSILLDIIDEIEKGSSAPSDITNACEDFFNCPECEQDCMECCYSIMASAGGDGGSAKAGDVCACICLLN